MSTPALPPLIRQIGINKWQYGARFLLKNPDEHEVIVDQTNGWKHILARDSIGTGFVSRIYLNDKLIKEETNVFYLR